MSQLFPEDEHAPAPEMSKSAFAEYLGISKARVSQLVEQGMPLTPNGRVPREEAAEWYRANIAAHRRKSDPIPLDAHPRRRLEHLRAEREALELAKARGELIDRSEASRAVFERAKAERDAHLAFVARIAPQLAGELDADPAATFAALDREMRAHLAELAETPLEAFERD